jgi:hypothetical protein
MQPIDKNALNVTVGVNAPAGTVDRYGLWRKISQSNDDQPGLPLS